MEIQVIIINNIITRIVAIKDSTTVHLLAKQFNLEELTISKIKSIVHRHIKLHQLPSLTNNKE